MSSLPLCLVLQMPLGVQVSLWHPKFKDMTGITRASLRRFPFSFLLWFCCSYFLVADFISVVKLTFSPLSPGLPVIPTGPSFPGEPVPPARPSGPGLPLSPCKKRHTSDYHKITKKTKHITKHTHSPCITVNLTLSPTRPSLPGDPSAPAIP